ncbi:hypothetical protein GJ698_02390 [Pseudoduganella sp. FT26W]|uniref:DUF1640 domain-containing protein n=1 Tax=Duganella aquatilis TaxID=2666082 RepID=A0A844D6V2_9BURK|nr:hypothetical protein [Duganella aquatilis]MRW82939.1 hypothetical protein [Duganella aquatilis]
MSNVKQLRDFNAIRNAVSGESFDGGDGGGYDGRMEARIAKLEEFATDAKERLVKIESRLEQTATKSDISDLKADLHKSSTDITRWMLATVISLFLGFAGLFFTMSNASKSAAVPQSPVTVYTQAPPAPAPIAPASAAASDHK